MMQLIKQFYLIRKLSKLKKKPNGWASTDAYNQAIEDAIRVIGETKL